jgi:TolB-like protein/tetratricopeptide (TPR) repeat protein
VAAFLSGDTGANMSLFTELERRNVFRVGVAYIVAAWVSLQVADLVLDAINAPDWVIQVLLLLIGLGFVAAIIIAWAYELTPDGIRREKDVQRDQSITHDTANKLNRITIGLVIAAVLIVVIDRFVPKQDGSSLQETPQPAASAEPKAAQQPAAAADLVEKSVAVLPFVNMSSDREQEFFSDGISEEILNVLVRIDDLRVPSRTSSFAFKGLNTDIKDIARQLDVGHILEGSVRKACNRVRVTAQLIDVSTDTHLWSETYDRELEDIFAIQDEIAGHIVDEMKLVLGPDDARQGTAKHTADLGAYESYLRGRYLFLQRGVASLTEAVAAHEAAVAQDPGFADAWAALAQSAVTLSGWDTVNADVHMAPVEEAARRALELDPKSATALSALGLMHQHRLNWAEALDYASRAAENARDSTPLYWYASLLQSVGYLRESVEPYAAAERLDPVYPQLQYGLGLLALHQDDVEAARQHMQRAIDGNNANGWTGMAYVHLAKRDADGFRAMMEAQLQQYTLGRLPDSNRTREDLNDILAALDNPNARARGIAAALRMGQVVALSWFGADEEILTFLQNVLEAEDTTTLANSLEGSIWLPTFKGLRQLPGFEDFLRDAGLADVWRERGWPDLCRPVGAEDFVCD